VEADLETLESEVDVGDSRESVVTETDVEADDD
jgi:hypothetical protein